MSDIMERLQRTTLSAPGINDERRQVPLNPDGPEAADEIGRLRAEKAELVEALERLEAHGHTQATWDFALRALAKARGNS